MTGWKGICPAVLDEAGVRTDDRGLVHVPYRRTDGSIHNVKLFSPRGRSWWQTTGLELIPFGLERLVWAGPKLEALVITEGESDALAFREAYGLRDDRRAWAYHVLGLPGASSWRSDWRWIVRPWPLVYVIGDGDDPGRRMMYRIVSDVPWARRVDLPDGEDVRSILQADAQSLDRYLDEADARARLSAAFVLADSLPSFRRLLEVRCG